MVAAVRAATALRAEDFKTLTQAFTMQYASSSGAETFILQQGLSGVAQFIVDRNWGVGNFGLVVFEVQKGTLKSTIFVFLGWLGREGATDNL